MHMHLGFAKNMHPESGGGQKRKRPIFTVIHKKQFVTVEDGLSLLDDYVNCILMDPYFTKPVFESEGTSVETHQIKNSSVSQSSDNSSPLSTKPSSSNFARCSGDVLDLTKDPADQKKPSSVLVLDALQVSIRKGTFDARSREVQNHYKKLVECILDNIILTHRVFNGMKPLV